MAQNQNDNTKYADGYTTPQGVYPGVPPIAVSKESGFEPTEYVPVGGVILKDDPIDYNVDRRTRKIKVRNTGDRPVQVGSHFHFFEVNRYLEFDRTLAYGYHLNIPATTAVRFEAGEEKEVEIVQYAGKMRVIGFDDLVNGYTGLEDSPVYYPKRVEAFRRMKEYGYKCVSEEEADGEYTENEIKKS